MMVVKPFLELSDGLKMPTLGLGTWQVKDEDELEKALNVALECGYRHIDTAFVYENEAIIGKVLKKWFNSGRIKRDELFITTKLPMVGVHSDRVEIFMKKSLENLQLDYVDLYLIHFPVGCKYVEGMIRPIIKENGDIDLEPITDHIAVWKKMEEQVDAGRTKTIGLSNFNVRQIANVLKSARIKPANLQVELHVYLQQRELVDFCHQNSITVVAYSPLGSPGRSQFYTSMGIETKQVPNMLHDPTIARIAQKHSKTLAQVLLRFLLQIGVVPIPKSVTQARLKENIDVYDFNLDSQDMNELHNLEVGEAARVADFTVWKGITKSPEFPM